MPVKNRRFAIRSVWPVLSGLAAASMLVGCAFNFPSSASETTAMVDKLALEQGFINPPNSARPRVWWHWLNANVSREGIRKDLEWMQRSGIGGLQNFDVNFSVPTIVDKPVVYMTEEWKDLYRYSVSLADQLGLEFGIAASPGWSETGGPWVKPEDGMKKLVWSETYLEGGRAFQGVLTPPPKQTGAYQELGAAKEHHPNPTKTIPEFYSDVAVLAFPVERPATSPVPKYLLNQDKNLDAAILSDGAFNQGLALPKPKAEAPVVINIQYDAPQMIRSATVYIPDSADIYAGASISASLEAMTESQQWQTVTDIQLSTVPTTVSFAAVRSDRFRITFKPVLKTRSNSGSSADGFDTAYMKAIAAMFSKPTMMMNELRLSAQAKVHQFEVKAGYGVARDYYALESSGNEVGIASTEVLNVTEHLQPDGHFNWTPPAGHWKVLRLGYSLLGKTNHPAIAEATGLEVDKLDSRAVRNYVETYLQHYREAVGPELIGTKGISALLTDSTEVGAFNWTPTLLEHFQRLRGYDATPWLPTLTGVIVDSPQQSDQFLYDFRRTLAELHASEHYGTVAQVAHENGLKVYGESLEGWRPSLGDDLDMRRFADYPMAALWAYQPDEGPKPLYYADMRGAASVAHLYGQNLAAAESMTSSRHPWNHTPADLRRVVDLEFLQGINRVVVHSSVHQPLDDKQPGLSMRHIGQFFNRHTAWAEMARPWMDYIARSSYLLQQGRFVADVAYFYGEEMPLGAQSWDGYLSDVPKQYGYDFVSASALMELFSVDQGDLVTGSGARYRVLYLSGSSERMTLPVLQRIAALAEQGATIIGNAPESSPSLHDDPQQFNTLKARLWSGKNITPIGKGQVISGKDVEAALRTMGVKADVELLNADADADIPFVHRSLPAGEIYFLNNRNRKSEQLDVRFRVTGKSPQIWRADTGTMEPVSYHIEGGQTVVPLQFAAEESYFLVFLDDATTTEKTVPVVEWQPVALLDGAWDLRFQAGRGAPDNARLAQLMPLNEHPEDGIKYFSGVSRYYKTFELPSGYQSGQPLMLDLGAVGDMAEVFVNGKKIGTVWHAPYRLDISAAVISGENQLEVRVANRWVNRLIGDAQPGSQKITFTVTPSYEATAPLRPSGLIGPVTLNTKTTVLQDNNASSY